MPTPTTPEPSAYAPYATVEEYINVWTDRIWQDRGVGLIRECYAPEVIVHGATGTVTGVEPVVHGTLQRITSFPDRIGGAEDIIWEARGSDGFISSHRSLHTGSHRGHSVYGPPTGHSFTFRGIAHCLVREGWFVEEWLVRDEYELVRALGLDPAEVAAGLAAHGGGTGRPTAQEPGADLLTGGVSGIRPAAHKAECELVLTQFDELWNQCLLDRTERFFAPDVRCHTTRSRTLQGRDQYRDDVISLLGCLPDAQLTVLDVAAHTGPDRGTRVAAVWRLEGHYTGVPAYGPPTGQPVSVLGISHYLVREGKIVEEWRVFDELALLVQIEGQRQAG
ncbi:ester cyclase family protein [Streptomyces sp. NPDC007107]|uniref:ester cyclase n=1 Tax=Streptomyces sp. NPDC007107 TaxID=3156915 RepID=UPI0033CB084D